MDEQAKEAVRRFLIRARAHPETGTNEALAARVSSYSRRYRINEGGIGHWIRKRNQPNAWILFALAADLDLSLDDFVFGERSFANRLAILERKMEDVGELANILSELPTADAELTKRKQATAGP